ncbi:hypothetical protein KC19_VG135100 [Ceratodon purpureus]|uniref:Uncharacterized protein n=1 Tax=Ceratodon purpureus TaxID=3225 RepID=A0A8T0HPQ6_CERPU|nr:hypothetical protein KC19_VG135100 [Ceratodon purpureus]
MEIEGRFEMAGQSRSVGRKNERSRVSPQHRREQLFASACNDGSKAMTEGVLACRRKLHTWFLEQGLSEGSATQAIRLCDFVYLEAQSRPVAWNRRGKFGIPERSRYLWYRHAAKLLGWYDRKQFPSVVIDILQHHVYPSPGDEDEESCACEVEDSRGRERLSIHALGLGGASPGECGTPHEGQTSATNEEIGNSLVHMMLVDVEEVNVMKIRPNFGLH